MQSDLVAYFSVLPLARLSSPAGLFPPLVPPGPVNLGAYHPVYYRVDSVFDYVLSFPRAGGFCEVSAQAW